MRKLYVKLAAVNIRNNRQLYLPSDCPNVEETRNQMQSSGWKKYTHFFQRMFHMQFHPKSQDILPIILLSAYSFYKAVDFREDR